MLAACALLALLDSHAASLSPPSEPLQNLHAVRQTSTKIKPQCGRLMCLTRAGYEQGLLDSQDAKYDPVLSAFGGCLSYVRSLLLDR